MTVKTRIAPSPTGWLHIGTARTALFNYLFAKHNGGTFAVRSEDTDRARSTKEFEDEIREGLAWLGLECDEYVRQSERVGRHQELLEKIVAEGKAYVSEEDSKNEPGKKVQVVRLKNPGASITFTDLVRSDITFDTAELGDFVIARAIDDPLYHFAVVVDDLDMEISHVIRGEDHISNTPRQILIQEALGAPRPQYAHLPLILAPDRTKLSKRHGATSLADYRAEGFLPQAFVNYMGLLGWSPGSDREDFSLQELASAFDLGGVQTHGAIWNREKLLDVNQRWMRKLSDEDFIKEGGLAAPDEAKLRQAVPLLKERAKTFGEARAMLAGELSGIFGAPSLDPAQLTAKEPADLPGATALHLRAFEAQSALLHEGMSAEEIKALLMPYADAIPKEQGGRGAALWPLRYALSGQERSPDPFTLISILGPEESRVRIQNALDILGG
ncbi:MAG TPA: glutamate--tRNA ligase family protein [Candidatus Paceibacterota bacterium]|jgi:glutamyl/glutaminyl-tRNA synthetase|nr:glutamate--tRNA ligase family protein [Candidatus Paceibacterota bacterium]